MGWAEKPNRRLRVLGALELRDLEGEDDAPGLASRDMDGRVVVGDDAVHDGQPQAGAASLGRVVGQEELAHILDWDPVGGFTT